MKKSNKATGKEGSDNLAFNHLFCHPELAPACWRVCEPYKAGSSERVSGSNKQKAFTLAEVLITLAIIGVVAALTIPTVVRNYQKQQTIVKLKKVYSTLSQAYNNSQAQNGMYQTWDKAMDIGTAEFFNRYWKPYFKIERICTTYQNCGYESIFPWINPNGNTIERAIVSHEARTTFYSQDGILYIIFSYTGEGSENSEIYVDLNGSKKPNIAGRDLFVFVRTDKGIRPYCYANGAANINNHCLKTGSGLCCAARLAKDGWEMKEDYPW